MSDMAQILALAGNEVRLKILLLLQQEQRLCVCDLGEILEMKVPAVSQHLRKMKDGGLVFTEREGTVIFYQLNPQLEPTLNTILNLIPASVLV
jgi:DNA-binding transcriptional ArsR family regulator